MTQRVRFLFTGRLEPEAFIAFARHRSARLALTMVVAEANTALVSVTVEGPADLVDAFEMACSLGPYECLVLDVVRTAA